MIAGVGLLYRTAAHTAEYRLTILLFTLAHAVALLLIDPEWLPERTRTLSGVLLLDLLVMGWLFPKISGLRFEDEPAPSDE